LAPIKAPLVIPHAERIGVVKTGAAGFLNGIVSGSEALAARGRPVAGRKDFRGHILRGSIRGLGWFIGRYCSTRTGQHDQPMLRDQKILRSLAVFPQ